MAGPVRPSLTELANRHATDKGTQGPSDTWVTHNYTDVYQAYLEDLRDAPLTILEIGLGVVGERWDARIVHGRNTGGASIKMWYDYFPSARIVGIDVNACPYLDNDRVRTFVADQGSVADLRAVLDALGSPTFDVIIDDGSHRPDHQQISLGCLFPRLAPGGIYFIEDLAANGIGDGVTGRHASDSVRNTRSVLRQLTTQGTFATPNALGDTDHLVRHIAYINFHSPAYGVESGPDGKLRVRHEPDTEHLCAIKKRT